MNASDPALATEYGRLIAAVTSQRTKTEALAMFMYKHGNPELSDEDREIIGPWEALDEVVQKIWINLADAAYIYLADEIDSGTEVHVHHHDIEAHAASFNEGYDEAVRQLSGPAEDPVSCCGPDTEVCDPREGVQP